MVENVPTNNMGFTFQNDQYLRQCSIAHTFNLAIQDLHKLFKEDLSTFLILLFKILIFIVFSNIYRNENCPITMYHFFENTKKFLHIH